MKHRLQQRNSNPSIICRNCTLLLVEDVVYLCATAGVHEQFDDASFKCPLAPISGFGFRLEDVFKTSIYLDAVLDKGVMKCKCGKIVGVTALYMQPNLKCGSCDRLCSHAEDVCFIAGRVADNTQLCFFYGRCINVSLVR